MTQPDTDNAMAQSLLRLYLHTILFLFCSIKSNHNSSGLRVLNPHTALKTYSRLNCAREVLVSIIAFIKTQMQDPVAVSQVVQV